MRTKIVLVVKDTFIDMSIVETLIFLIISSVNSSVSNNYYDSFFTTVRSEVDVIKDDLLYVK